MGRLVAGVAAVPLGAPLGAPMMGYAVRSGGAERSHDELSARALYLGAERDLLLVACDLCLVAPSQAAALRRRIAEATGVAAQRVLVHCIHTHAGPDTGFAALLAGSEPAGYVAGLLDAALEAARRARAGAAPARLGIGRARARIGRNRRRADGPVDPDVLVARVDGRRGQPLAVLFVHGCHPTVLGHENLAYSADWPWAARACVEEAFPGAIALFLLGAHADVDPRTRGLMDLAQRDQSRGVGFDQVERLGRELGAAVVEAAAGVDASAEAAVDAGASRIRVPVHGADRDRHEAEALLAAARRDALAALDLPPDAAVGTAELFRMERERTQTLAAPERRERIARVRRYLRDRTAPRFAFGRLPDVEAQLLRVGEARLLALPAEPTVDVGLDWKRRMGSAPAAVVGIANGWLRYLPHPTNFEEPDAHLHYEILQSTLVPDAASRLLDEGERLAQGLDA